MPTRMMLWHQQNSPFLNTPLTQASAFALTTNLGVLVIWSSQKNKEQQNYLYKKIQASG